MLILLHVDFQSSQQHLIQGLSFPHCVALAPFFEDYWSYIYTNSSLVSIDLLWKSVKRRERAVHVYAAIYKCTVTFTKVCVCVYICIIVRGHLRGQPHEPSLMSFCKKVLLSILSFFLCEFPYFTSFLKAALAEYKLTARSFSTSRHPAPYWPSPGMNGAVSRYFYWGFLVSKLSFLSLVAFEILLSFHQCVCIIVDSFVCMLLQIKLASWMSVLMFIIKLWSFLSLLLQMFFCIFSLSSPPGIHITHILSYFMLLNISMKFCFGFHYFIPLKFQII